MVEAEGNTQERIRDTASRYKAHGVTVKIDRSYDPEVHVTGPGIFFYLHGEDAELLLDIAEMACLERDVSEEDAILGFLDCTGTLLGASSRRRGWIGQKSVAVHIGQFGEVYARQWLSERGYDVRDYLSLLIDLEPLEWHHAINRRHFLPELEYRKRRIPSLTDRIAVLEKKIQAVKSSGSSNRHLRWVKNRETLVGRMKKALEDFNAGKQLEDIDDPERGQYASDLPWSLYRQDLEVKRAEVRRFLGPRIDDFLRLAKEKELGLADFVAKKGDEYYIVEVKTNTSRLTSGKQGWRVILDSGTGEVEERWRADQQESLRKVEKFGFKPMVIRVRFDADCSEESFVK